MKNLLCFAVLPMLTNISFGKFLPSYTEHVKLFANNIRSVYIHSGTFSYIDFTDNPTMGAILDIGPNPGA